MIGVGEVLLGAVVGSGVVVVLPMRVLRLGGATGVECGVAGIALWGGGRRANGR